jgi:hypothetical protein
VNLSNVIIACYLQISDARYGGVMKNLDERKNAYENKFAHDEEFKFKAKARCCKLFGKWIAGELGFSESDAEALVAKIISVNVNSPDLHDIKETVRPYIEENGADISDNIMDKQIENFLEEAKEQLFAQES